MALTKRQKQVLDFIANFVDENGYCPSFEEIAQRAHWRRATNEQATDGR